MDSNKKSCVKVYIYSPKDLNKRWFIEYSNPKPIRKYYGLNKIKNYKERLKKAQEIKNELENSLIPYLQDIEYLADSIKYEFDKILNFNKKIWTKNTINSYSSILNSFIEHLRLFGVSEKSYKEYFQKKIENKSPTTYNNHLSVLKSVLNKKSHYDWILNLKKIKACSTPQTYFQVYQQNILKDYISKIDPQLWFFIQLIYYTLARPNEIRRLKLTNANFDFWTLLYPSFISKNRKSLYTALPLVFRNNFEDYLKGMNIGDYLFPSPVKRNAPISKNYMNNKHRLYLSECGFPLDEGYSLYSWKHTGAIMASQAGIPIKQISIQLRHSSLDETDKYLRQLGVQDLDKFIENMPVLGFEKTHSDINKKLKVVWNNKA